MIGMDGGRCARTVSRLRAEALEAAARDARRLRLVHDLEVGIRAEVAAEPPPLLPGLRLDARDIVAVHRLSPRQPFGFGTAWAKQSHVDHLRAPCFAWNHIIEDKQ